MLIALTSGKAGTIGTDIGPGASWREVFRASEDLLTASAFGRLTYLEGPVLWQILRRATGSTLPDYKLVELISADFWPRFAEADDSGYTVEPDVLLRFEVGDPSVRIDFIVEAKLGTGASQYAEQWRRQWTAFKKMNEEGDAATIVYLLAVGGLGSKKALTVERIVSDLASTGTLLNAVAATWGEIADGVHQQLENSVKPSERRVLNDVIGALALANYRHVDILRDLHSARRFTQAAIDKISAYDFKETKCPARII
ncbi:hypothetical protein HFO24_06580 [Rhizobium laguerreae]|uniref:hypothetical protein n=1 Tax=Rhizobium laguerreae TaxID=1076926 RepID=UPI001C8FAD3C|nr:hypothetical protein [Rhizobium laguerreae]MBY3181335.1 hypothetical protein [Rhizobium laguerreae]